MLSAQLRPDVVCTQQCSSAHVPRPADTLDRQRSASLSALTLPSTSRLRARLNCSSARISDALAVRAMVRAWSSSCCVTCAGSLLLMPLLVARGHCSSCTHGGRQRLTQVQLQHRKLQQWQRRQSAAAGEAEPGARLLQQHLAAGLGHQVLQHGQGAVCVGRQGQLQGDLVAVLQALFELLRQQLRHS